MKWLLLLVFWHGDAIHTQVISMADEESCRLAGAVMQEKLYARSASVKVEWMCAKNAK